MLFVWGFIAGIFLTFLVTSWAHFSYLRMLVAKAKDHTVECIGGEFFNIIPEKEYMELSVLKWRQEYDEAGEADEADDLDEPDVSESAYDTHYEVQTPSPITMFREFADVTQHMVRGVLQEKTPAAAYYVWQEAGCPASRDLEFWLAAEERLYVKYMHMAFDTIAEMNADGERLNHEQFKQNAELALNQQRAARAYMLWEAAGHPQGRDLEFWLAVGGG